MRRLAATAAALTRPRSWVPVALVLLSGCPRDPTPETTPAAKPSAAEETAELRKQAQKEALERLAPKVAELAALEDPVTSALRDDAAPRMPPLLPKDRAALRTALEAADREAEGITPGLLSPTDRVLALTSRFAIDRARDVFLRRNPWVDDPTWMTREAALVIDALELAARRSGTCSHCDVSLPHLAGSLAVVSKGPHKTSNARATAAALDARALAGRVRSLPGQAEAPAATALEAFASAIEAKLPADDEPDRLGKAVLQRQLEVEENLGQSATQAFQGLGASVTALAAMAEKHPMAPQDPATAVTFARCDAAWGDIAPLIEGQDALSAGGFACERFVAGLGTTALDDVYLRIAIVDVALVGPLRQRAQRATPSLLSSVGGRIARGSQSHTLRSALLLGSPALEPAAARALRAELDTACLAAAALWIHGELGDDAALAKRLDAQCPDSTPSYISRAEARPRQSLEGLALARIPLGPAGVVPLDKLWWLPAGLIDDVAMPPPDDDSPSGVRAIVEPLRSGDAPEPAQDSAP